MAILSNFPLLSALAAIVLAQFVKVPLHLFREALPSEEAGERKKLKELLGHRPIEVVAGAAFGAAVGIGFGLMHG